MWFALDLHVALLDRCVTKNSPQREIPRWGQFIFYQVIGEKHYSAAGASATPSTTAFAATSSAVRARS